MNSKSKATNSSWKNFNRFVASGAGMLLWLAAGSSEAQPYTVLHNFNEFMNETRYGKLVLSGATLYGTSFVGGSSNMGTVFSISTDGTDYVVLRNFAGGTDGMNPISGLVLSDSTLYGTTFWGGDYSYGTVFKIGTNGTGYAVLKSFSGGADGSGPKGGLVCSDTTLYGTTFSGGSSNVGTVFKLNTDGSGFSVLKAFEPTAGNGPEVGLVLSGSTLYGVTSSGPSGGTVFKMDTDGSGYTVLAVANYAPSPLVLSGSTLYGTTTGGGVWMPSNMTWGGTLFQVNTDGSRYAELRLFSGLDGMGPEAGLVSSGSTLYGSTCHGGITFPPWGGGVLFKINTDGSDYAVLKNFDYGPGTSGMYPAADLVFSDGMVYGTTTVGGISNGGVLFSMSVAPPSIENGPQTQTAEVGSTVSISVNTAGFFPQSYQWFFNQTSPVTAANADSILLLTNIAFPQAGVYTLVVGNALGTATSSPALLNVIAPVERRPVAGVKVAGEGGSLVNVDYASSLNPASTWTTLGSVSLTSTRQYCFDLTLPLPPQRFYRGWQTGMPGVKPSLNVHMIPAITLTGGIGHSVRLDYINQFGPTDAWVMLDTVTLTNTSQLYFDTSSIGQPARLWRIVPIP